MVLGPGADEGGSPEVKYGPGLRTVAFRQVNRGFDPGTKGRFPEVKEGLSPRSVVKREVQVKSRSSSSTFAS